MMATWKNDAAKAAVRTADALEDAGDIPGAIEALTSELRAQPGNAPLLARRGRLNYLTKQWPEALDDFTKALAEKPDAESTLYYRGMTNAELNNVEDAIRDLTAVTRLNPTAGDAWSELGMLYRFKGKATASAEAFQKALDIDAEAFDWVREYLDTRRLD